MFFIYCSIVSIFILKLKIMFKLQKYNIHDDNKWVILTYFSIVFGITVISNCHRCQLVLTIDRPTDSDRPCMCVGDFVCSMPLHAFVGVCVRAFCNDDRHCSSIWIAVRTSIERIGIITILTLIRSATGTPGPRPRAV